MHIGTFTFLFDQFLGYVCSDHLCASFATLVAPTHHNNIFVLYALSLHYQGCIELRFTFSCMIYI